MVMDPLQYFGHNRQTYKYFLSSLGFSDVLFCGPCECPTKQEEGMMLVSVLRASEDRESAWDLVFWRSEYKPYFCGLSK